MLKEVGFECASAEIIGNDEMIVTGLRGQKTRRCASGLMETTTPGESRALLMKVFVGMVNSTTYVVFSLPFFIQTSTIRERLVLTDRFVREDQRRDNARPRRVAVHAVDRLPECLGESGMVFDGEELRTVLWDL